MFRLTLALGVLGGCRPDDPAPTPGGTRGDDDDDQEVPCRTEVPGDPFYAGPVAVETVDLACLGPTAVADVCVVGWTGRAEWWLVDAETEEHHDLRSVQFDAEGAWDELLVELATGAASAARGEATTFDCERFAGASSTVLVWDGDGVSADCVVSGPEPVVPDGWACRTL